MARYFPGNAEQSVTYKVRDITVGAADGDPGIYFRVNATVAGNVVVKFSNGGTETITVDVGYSVFPYAVVAVNTTGTTATATYANLA